MSRFPRGLSRSAEQPAFLTIARAFYADAFGVGLQSDLDESVAEWSALTEAERSFAIAHLLFLGLVAQAGAQESLTDAIDLLDDLADSLEERLEERLEASLEASLSADLDVPEADPPTEPELPLEDDTTEEVEGR